MSIKEDVVTEFIKVGDRSPCHIFNPLASLSPFGLHLHLRISAGGPKFVNDPPKDERSHLKLPISTTLEEINGTLASEKPVANKDVIDINTSL